MLNTNIPMWVVCVCVCVCVCVKLRPSQLQSKKKKAMLTTTEGKFGKQHVFQGDSFIHLTFLFK